MKRILRAVTLLTLLSSVTLCTRASITIVATQVAILCNGGDGSINITPSGGTAPYTYHWSNGTTLQNLSNVPTGAYQVTVTDNTGATSTANYNVIEPSPIFVSRHIVNENCGGQDIGSITLTVTGGTAPFNYQWTNGATTQNLSNLTAAVYYVTITDGNGCVDVDSANVTQPIGIGITMADTNVSCSGGANGAIGLTVQYGNTPYQYAWNNGATTQNVSGLMAGFYEVTVTDAIGCTATDTVTLTQQPGTISINTSLADPTCHNGTNGTINITSVVGGVAPYTFLWNDGITTQSRTGLSAGIYSVTATASTGCSASAAVTLTQPNAINVTFHTVDPTCFGNTNGAITTTATLGTSPYSYLWSNGDATANIFGLAGGSYTVTVMDFKGCTVAATDVVTAPTQIVVTPTTTPISCGGATGSISTTVTGGTPAYTYFWGGGVFTPGRTNVGAGTYSVTVTDAHSCTATASATIAPYISMTATIAETDVVCYGNNNGTIAINVNNGVAPYTYLWSNGDTGTSDDSLAAGTYVITVTDAHGCTISKSSTVSAPPFPITVNSTATDVTCFGLNNGSLSLNPINGAPPYNYKWGNGATTLGISGLSPGNYVVTITDNAGCKANDVFSITQPALIIPVTTVTNATCFGTNSGAIGLTVTGGYSPFSYLWNDGADTMQRTGLHAGFYQLTVTDNHNCTVTTSATVGQPSLLTVSTSPINPTCFTGTNGSITATASGGTAAYNYNWGGAISGATRSGLSAGTYNVTATDNMGCTAHASSTLTSPSSINITSTSTNVACNGGNNGTITITVTGGTSPYGFDWGGGVNSQNRNNLTSGNYNVTVTDNLGCTATATASVNESTTMVLATAVTNVSCFGLNNGSVTASVTGGSSPYNYNWSNGNTTHQISNVISGNYIITVTDQSGCSTSLTSTVTEPSLLSVSSTTTAATCFGSSTGAIHITANGGTAPYTYNWGGGINTQNRTNVAAANYSVTVTDSVGCSVLNTTTVSQASQVVISANQTNISCNGGSNGSIQITTTGGTGGYTYNWGGGVISQNRTALTSGSYTVTVSDANACTASDIITLTQPNALGVGATVTNVSCFGQATGGVALTVTGGTPNYVYSWNNGASIQHLVNIDTGSYTVTVTDAQACTASISATVTQPAQMSTSIPSVINASCFGATNGGINIHINGGTPNYFYAWSTGATTQNISGVAAGTYNVSVTDAHNCTTSSAINVQQPNQITLTSAVTNVNCFGGNTGSILTFVNGGNGGYTYNWSNGATTGNLNNVVAGSYTLTVNDAQHCNNTFTMQVTEPTQIAITSTQTNVTCSGGNTGAAAASVTGGTGTYTYNWSSGQTTSQITQLATGNYSLTVKDANLCSVTANIDITQINSIILSLATTNVTCSGANNGAVSAQVSGGAGGYTFNWSNQSTAQQISQLVAGPYSVTVHDANLCSVSQSAAITQPTPISVTSTHSDYECLNSGGAINITASGGTSPYTYNWPGGNTSQNRTGLTTGSYTVTVTDQNHCIQTNSTTIGQLAQLATALTTTNVTCFGGNNGAIIASVTGGVSPYSYSWNNSVGGNSIQQLAARQYNLVVTDANGCSATAAASISQSSAIQALPTVTNITCFGQSDGLISISTTGGASPYRYLWSNNSTAQSVANVVAGSYQVTITDANNCTAVVNGITVSQPAQISLTATITPVGCAGQNNGKVKVNVQGGLPPYLYEWSNNEKDGNLDSLAAGTYSLTVADNNGCTNSKSFIVTSSPPLSVTATSQNTSCIGVTNGNVGVAVTGGTAPYTYDWSNGMNNETITDLGEGTYNVTVTDAMGCSAQSGGSVAVSYALTVHASATAAGTTGGQVELTATTNVDHSNSYNWTPADAVSCGNCANTAAQPQQTTLFTVNVVDANGCKAVDTVTVDVNNGTNIFIPNVFTPNADGVNDQFKIFGDLSNVYFFDMAVFDRWGEKVFESNDANFEWDGTYRGKPSPEGVYVYTAQLVFSNGSHRDLKGSVTLLK